MGLTMLNLATNIMFNRALNASGRVGDTPSLIQPLFETFPPVGGTVQYSLLFMRTHKACRFNFSRCALRFSFFHVSKQDSTALEWLVLFCAGMTVFPAFSALYVARERQSAVKTMQLSNGISNPVGLWCGHLLFDSISTLVMATLVVVLFATLSNQFYGLGILVG